MTYPDFLNLNETLKTYIEQTNDPIRQQMLRFLKSEVLLDRNVFENFDLSNKCMYDGQYDLALFVCKNIMTKETPYLCYYDNELSDFKNIFFQKLEIMFDSSKEHYDSKVKYDEDTKKFRVPISDKLVGFRLRSLNRFVYKINKLI